MRKRPTARAGALVVAAALIAACGGGGQGLQLTLIDASVQRPSNIALFFTVETRDGEPVPDLPVEAFQIYEGGQPVSELESKQTILNKEVASEHFLLLLVDMSGSVTESDDVPVIVESARAFGERVERSQKVAVYAFDGSRRVHPIVGFSTGSSLARGIARLGTFRTRDPSTNLNGAVVEALRILERQMSSSRAPLTFGTLIVFTDGSDRAHRVSRDEVYEALDATSADVIVIGVGEEIDEGELRALGRRGAILTRDGGQIASSFEKAAARVDAFSRRYYLLGYCSPARAGVHELSVVAHSEGLSGSLEHTFDASGFGAGCNPERTPSFNVKRPRKRPPADRGPRDRPRPSRR